MHLMMLLMSWILSKDLSINDEDKYVQGMIDALEIVARVLIPIDHNGELIFADVNKVDIISDAIFAKIDTRKNI